MQKLTREHEAAVSSKPRDVFTMALESYSAHLKEIEGRDIKALKKSILEMKRVKADLLKDLEEAEQTESELLQGH